MAPFDCNLTNGTVNDEQKISAFTTFFIHCGVCNKS